MIQKTKKTETPAKLLAEYRLASFYKAAGDPTRLSILRVLARNSFGVQELAFIFQMAQPAMSHHLKVLSGAGLVQSRRQGNIIFYRRAMVRSAHFHEKPIEGLFAEVDRLTLHDAIHDRVNQVHKDRSERSQNFFKKNPTIFMEKQGLLCELDAYLPNMIELLDLVNLSKNARVMEVGPGHGAFLRELSGRYSNLYALDHSKEILDVARKQMAGRREKIQFICDVFQSYRLQENQSPFDLVIFNMVLHHMPSPAVALKCCSEILAAQGYLLIADLMPHDQSWVKNSCGDLWMGFEPEELDQWAKDSGFKERQSLFLGLKNGFQIQLRLFKKCLP